MGKVEVDLNYDETHALWLMMCTDMFAQIHNVEQFDRKAVASVFNPLVLKLQNKLFQDKGLKSLKYVEAWALYRVATCGEFPKTDFQQNVYRIVINKIDQAFV